MNYLIEAFSAFQQLKAILGGTISLAVGGLFIGWYLYRHSNRKVRGCIAALQVSNYMINPEGGIMGQYPYARERLHPVCEYRDETGATIRATYVSDSNPTDKIPGTLVWLYVNSAKPEIVMRAGKVWPIVFGIVFAAAGGLVLYSAFTDYKFNPLSPFVMAAVLGITAANARKFFNKENRIPRASSAKFSDSENLHTLTIQEVRERVRFIDRTNSKIMPVMTLLSIGIIGLGIHLGSGLQNVLLEDQHTQGQVVKLAEIYNPGRTAHRISNYIYYPVVRFNLPDGPHEFQDRVGGNPPAYRIGDQVTVLYSAAEPEKAKIDHGVWNWVLPVGCILGGLMVLILSIKGLIGIGRRKIFVAGASYIKP